MSQPTIVITVNSPGEVSAWLFPVLLQLKSRLPEAPVCVVIPPCPFASGAEVEIVKNLPHVAQVIGPDQALGLLVRKRPASFTARGVVLFLGGDPTYAVKLARRLGYPAAMYIERMAGRLSFDAYFASDDEVAEKLTSRGHRNVNMVGNLMASAVNHYQDDRELSERLDLGEEDIVISLFPGSRPWQVRHLVPFFFEVVELLKGINAQFVMVMSPFIDEELFAEATSNRSSILGGSTATCLEKKESGDSQRIWSLTTEQGRLVKAVWGQRYGMMRRTNLALTIPGTNTAELGYLHVPTVVVVPLNRPEIIPMPGLIQWIGKVPLMGPLIKELAIRAYLKRNPYLALPNRWVDCEIMPECKGSLRAEDVVCCVQNILENSAQLEKMREQLAAIAPTRDTASVIVDLLIEQYGLKGMS